ncbi:MAG: ABC transporter permease subunit, partial [Granulosicoccaceae bacterium]
QREHILAARALGTADPVTLFRHVLPLMLAPLLVEASFSMAGAVVAEAGLSFLGLGVQAPQASWGGMLRDGVRYLLVAPHMTLVPALAVMAVVLSVNMLGDRLRDSLDVRQR